LKQKKPDNRFPFFVSKSFFFSPFLVSLPVGPDNRLGFPKENLPGIPSLPFSAFFCPFFFKKKKAMKKDEKGWDRKGYKKTFPVSLICIIFIYIFLVMLVSLQK